MPTASDHNPLWSWSLAFYAQPEVPPLCLALQDRYAVDINLLCYAAWLGTQGRVIAPSQLAAADREIARWRQDVVGPLRALRVQLRDYPAAQAVRAELAQLELRAEREAQQLLYNWHGSGEHLSTAARPTLDNLTAVLCHAAPHDDDWQPYLARLAALAGA